jgi:hypothetical protein
MIPNTTRTGSADCRLDGSMARTEHQTPITQTRLISPEERRGKDPEYQRNIEERHDNAAEHAKDLNNPHKLYGSTSVYRARSRIVSTASNPFC